MRPPRALTLDVTHTLIHCPRLGEIYSEVLERHGIAADPAAIRRLVPAVWREFACSSAMGRDRFMSHPEGPEGWWHQFLLRLCQHLESPRPSRFAAAELYRRFARADAWEVYPDVRPTLRQLRAGGVPMAVVSNWDPRLPGLLAALDLASPFAALVYSAAAGVEKPHPRIFRAAVDRLGTRPEETLHVGDGPVEDLEGARAAGLQALLLDREGGRGDLEDLTPLVAMLGGVC